MVEFDATVKGSDQIVLVLYGIFSSERSGLSHEARCPYLILNLRFERRYNSLCKKLPIVFNSLLTYMLRLLGEEKDSIKRKAGKE